MSLASRTWFLADLYLLEHVDLQSPFARCSLFTKANIFSIAVGKRNLYSARSVQDLFAVYEMSSVLHTEYVVHINTISITQNIFIFILCELRHLLIGVMDSLPERELIKSLVRTFKMCSRCPQHFCLQKGLDGTSRMKWCHLWSALQIFLPL